MYTTSYPIARISLTLLYRRIFIQSWVRVVSLFLIFCYAGYAIGSFFADIFTFNPIASAWDTHVKRTHTINIKALYLANSGFNIATDFILLILPLAAIYNLRMSRLRKMGLGFIFCLGCLTVIASIFRLALYYTYDTFDPNCKPLFPTRLVFLRTCLINNRSILAPISLTCTTVQSKSNLLIFHCRRSLTNPMVDPRGNGSRNPLPLLRNHATPPPPRLRLHILATLARKPVARRARPRRLHLAPPLP